MPKAAASICVTLMFLIGIASATTLVLYDKEWWSVMMLIASLIFCCFILAIGYEEVEIQEPVETKDQDSQDPQDP